jgi:hypothetical protein
LSLREYGKHSLSGSNYIRSLYSVASVKNECTGGPHCMREIGTPKIGSHIVMNLHIKRPRITINERISSRKKDILNHMYKKSLIKRRTACRYRYNLYAKQKICKSIFPVFCHFKSELNENMIDGKMSAGRIGKQKIPWEY